MIDAALPWGNDVVKNAVANLLAARFERVAQQVGQRQRGGYSQP